MKLLVVLEHHFVRCPKGVFTDLAFAYDYWQEFLKVFDEIIVTTRVENSPVRVLRKRSMTEKKYSQLIQAIEIAVKQTGQIDYIMPAAFPYPRHTNFTRDMYGPLQKAGKFSILPFLRLSEEKKH